MKLSKLKIISNNDNIVYDVEFSDKATDTNGPFSTVIIGVNGAGKSYLLTVLSELIIYTSKNKGPHSWQYRTYELEYYRKGKLEKIIIDSKNSKDKLVDCKELNVLAVSFMVNDKFPFSRNIDKTGYRYLGQRQSTNSAYTSKVETQIISNLLNIITDPVKLKKTKQIFEAIELEPRLTLNIKLNKNITDQTLNKFLRENLSTEKVEKGEIKARFSDKFLSEAYNDLTKRNKVVSYLKKVIANSNIDSIDLFSEKNDFNDFLYQVLRRTRQMADFDLILYKNNEDFSFKWASSGEKQMLFNLLNIIVNIKEEAIILIDEPEISLHPNWQMKYIEKLKGILKEYNCHILIATHSPYIVSDLDPKSSSLLPLEQRKICRPLPYSTYAWSIENILYKVFEVRTTRNYYFEQDLTKLVDLCANTKLREKKVSEIQELYDRLSKYVLSGDDPLKEFLLDIGKEIKCSGDR